MAKFEYSLINKYKNISLAIKVNIISVSLKFSVSKYQVVQRMSFTFGLFTQAIQGLVALLFNLMDNCGEIEHSPGWSNYMLICAYIIYQILKNMV